MNNHIREELEKLLLETDIYSDPVATKKAAEFLVIKAFAAGREAGIGEAREDSRLQKIAEACKAEVHLNANGQATNYETLREYLETRNTLNEQAEFSPEELERFVAAGRVYELQFYPDTPIGSYHVYGTTVDEVLTKVEGILTSEGKLTALDNLTKPDKE